MLSPMVVPLTMAIYSVIGEKSMRTLEPLLATPVGVGELLFAKSLASTVPSVIVTWTAYAFYLTSVVLLGSRAAVNAVTAPRWVLAILVMVPLLTLLSVNLGILISTRVNDVRVAQQIGGLVVVPVVVTAVRARAVDGDGRHGGLAHRETVLAQLVAHAVRAEQRRRDERHEERAARGRLDRAERAAPLLHRAVVARVEGAPAQRHSVGRASRGRERGPLGDEERRLVDVQDRGHLHLRGDEIGRVHPERERGGRGARAGERVPARIGQPDGHAVVGRRLRGVDAHLHGLCLVGQERRQGLRPRRTRHELVGARADLPDKPDGADAGGGPRPRPGGRDRHA